MNATGLRARRLIPAVAIVLWLVPATAAAQECWFEAGVYADFWDSGVEVVEVYGAAWDASWCDPPVCYHGYGLDVTAWYNSVSLETSHFDDTYGVLVVDVTTQGRVDYQVTLTLWCSCAGGFLPVAPAGGSQVVERPCPEIPNEPFFGAMGLLYTYSILDSAPGHAPMSNDEKEVCATASPTGQPRTCRPD